MRATAEDEVHYTAAGGVLIDRTEKHVLLLIRPARDEVRLPKGHVEAKETLEEAALREVREESGYADVEILTYLGQQRVAFTYEAQAVQRVEHYYLMQTRSEQKLAVEETDPQFFPIWVTWAEARERLTFDAERTWVNRAEARLKAGKHGP
ncbi:MAG: NUDIX domain-containing protein [Anaerolineae bacterium]